MIVSKTPVRMSFVGGGSDLPNYFERRAGAVLSTTIDKFIYVTINKKFDDGLRVAYSKNEEVASIEELSHPIVKQSMRLLEVTSGAEITTIADIPSRGSGLGSSSSFTVGILNGLSAYLGTGREKRWLAETAYHVERNLCKEPIGKQDPFAAAYGGFNVLTFFPDGRVDVSPVRISQDTLEMLENNSMLFYTGITRSASPILDNQSKQLAARDETVRITEKMAGQVPIAKQLLESGDLDGFAHLLHEAWCLKRSISSGISTSAIDEAYECARTNGAIGGKLLGAGAGGFMLIYAPLDRQRAIRSALSNMRLVSFRFDHLGSQIILNNR